MYAVLIDDFPKVQVLGRPWDSRKDAEVIADHRERGFATNDLSVETREMIALIYSTIRSTEPVRRMVQRREDRSGAGRGLGAFHPSSAINNTNWIAFLILKVWARSYSINVGHEVRLQHNEQAAAYYLLRSMENRGLLQSIPTPVGSYMNWGITDLGLQHLATLC